MASRKRGKTMPMFNKFPGGWYKSVLLLNSFYFFDLDSFNLRLRDPLCCTGQRCGGLYSTSQWWLPWENTLFCQQRRNVSVNNITIFLLYNSLYKIFWCYFWFNVISFKSIELPKRWILFPLDPYKRYKIMAIIVMQK